MCACDGLAEAPARPPGPSVGGDLRGGECGGALAHVAYGRLVVWRNSSGKCIEAYAETSHGKTGNGYFKTTGTTRQRDILGVDCGASYWTQPVGYIAVRSLIYRSSPTNDPGYLCKALDWKYKHTRLRSMRTFDDVFTQLCGMGYYGEYGGAFAWFDSAWRGGYIWSDCHWLPTGISAEPCQT